MKKLFNWMTIATLAITVLAACNEEDDPNNQVVISGVPATASVEVEESIDPVAVNITAADGLTTLVVKRNGTTIETINYTGEVSATYDFNYEATEEDADSNIVFEIIATDMNGDTQTSTFVVTVGEISTIVRVDENITADQVWETGKVYVLGSRITVTEGVELIIEPGVIVKGEAGSGANATALVIARGATIEAEGTADQPIIFTSIADEITPGMIASPNLDPDIDGLWGGLLVLGRAPGSFAGDVSEVQIEGIPPSDTNGLHGGDNPEDYSGKLKYISIRHGGANIGEGNEINGLTLGSVGSATIIENIEVIANQDDGIEWFGGTVNVKNAIIWNAGDDALDTDMAWSGTLDNFIVINGSSTDHSLEIDGPEGSFNDGHTLQNGIIVGNDVAELGDFRDGARGTFKNILFQGFADPAETEGRGDFSISGDKSLENFQNGDLAFENLEVVLADGVALTDVFKNGTDAHATAVTAGANTVGADKSVFSDWTWSAEAGNLDNL
ncbi:MAG: hypothetical protein GYB55_04435 [Cytophagales bacterium]|uniref:hypothetical protein n=1 Tax=Cyclobacterium marinum TaxID=104 RepID=UPI0011EC9D12|nr:hypothetical protein [Cyclobacterium marinum]MBI0399366.1 hypothetical protein [Cyclobacterium marinum]MBR9774279.1 hypothetical protein [Cytophagales bacterium]|tara:strand:- start:42662 stop:44164 length:1503 start_codon:yes stop_codon:yes gene_type:complete